jgi:hypothetical protein
MMTPNYDQKLHSRLLEVGNKIEKSQTHSLEPPFINAVLGTLEYFGSSNEQLQLARFDLCVAKYKIYDWLGMAYTGRYQIVQDPLASQTFFETIQKLVKLYVLMQNVGGFGWFLRGHDLDVEEPALCEHCIKSYNEWHNQTPEQRQAEQAKRDKFWGEPIEV